MSTSTTTAEEKRRLRNTIRHSLAARSSQELQASDQALFSAFLSLPQVQQSQTLFLFWGIPGREPETEFLVRTLAAQGKLVGLPRMLPGHSMEVRLYQPEAPLVPVSFGLWEPSPAAPLLEKSSIQLALIPALCYDRAGFRLGFGGGYYDRWLADFSGFSVGFCRDFLLQEQVPREPHDCSVSLLLTESRQFSPSGHGKSGAFAPLSAP